MQPVAEARDLARITGCVVWVDNRAYYVNEINNYDLAEGFFLRSGQHEVVRYTDDRFQPGPFTLGYVNHNKTACPFVTKVLGRSYSYGLNTANLSFSGLMKPNKDQLTTRAFGDMLENTKYPTYTTVLRGVVNDRKRQQVHKRAFNRNFALSTLMNIEVITLLYKEQVVATSVDDGASWQFIEGPSMSIVYNLALRAGMKMEVSHDE